MPSSLRLAGSSAMPSRCASSRRARRDRLAVAAASRRWWRGRCRRRRRRSPRRRSRPARRGRRSRPRRTATFTSWNLPVRPSPSRTSAGGAVRDLAVRPLVGQDAADHELGDLAHRELADRVGADRLPVAHHGDLVGDPEQLVEPVRDVDDRDAGGGEPADDVEQHLDLGVGQDRRRLVQDEHGRARPPAPWRSTPAAARRSRASPTGDGGVARRAGPAARAAPRPWRSARPRRSGRRWRISRPVKMFSETVSSANSCGSW